MKRIEEKEKIGRGGETEREREINNTAFIPFLLNLATTNSRETSFSFSFLLNTKLGYNISIAHRELRLICYVMCGFLGFFFFFLSRQREITVLYPSLADWSESPPYSALPRPGVEPLENKKRQLYACVFLFFLSPCCPHPRTIT